MIFIFIDKYVDVHVATTSKSIIVGVCDGVLEGVLLGDIDG